MTGKLLVLEGTDGAGKATQSKLLREWLEGKGFKVASFSYPDYSSQYGKIIESFLYSKIQLSVDEQFLVYILDMVKDIGKVRKALDEGFVLMDRYLFSTIAYQCANGFDYQRAKALTWMLGLEQPLAVFYINIPLSVSMARKGKQKAEAGESEDKFEKDQQLLTMVRHNYDTLMKDKFYSENWFVVDGSGDKNAVSRDIQVKLSRLIGGAA